MVFKRFVLAIGAIAIGLSGCASAYRNAPVVAEDLIVEHHAVIWTMDGTEHRGIIEATEERGVLLIKPGDLREWIALEDIRTLKHTNPDRKSLPWVGKLALWTFAVFTLLSLAVSQIDGSVGGS